MNMKPYIGVSGIEEPEQLDEMLTLYSQRGDITHEFMPGLIVSYKTLIGVKDKRIVLMEDEVRSIFEELKKKDSKNVFPTLHFYTKHPSKVRSELGKEAIRITEKPLHEQVSRLIGDIYKDYKKTKPLFHLGLQINVSWPDPAEINQIKKYFPDLKIILQVSDFESLDKRIRKQNAHCYLVDPSRGEGIDYTEKAVRAFSVINEKKPNAKIGIAGGINPENVRERISSLRKKLRRRDFCIDAQTGLRTEGYLDMNKVERYLEEAIEAFQ